MFISQSKAVCTAPAAVAKMSGSVVAVHECSSNCRELYARAVNKKGAGPRGEGGSRKT